MRSIRRSCVKWFIKLVEQHRSRKILQEDTRRHRKVEEEIFSCNKAITGSYRKTQEDPERYRKRLQDYPGCTVPVARALQCPWRWCSQWAVFRMRLTSMLHRSTWWRWWWWAGGAMARKKGKVMEMEKRWRRGKSGAMMRKRRSSYDKEEMIRLTSGTRLHPQRSSCPRTWPSRRPRSSALQGRPLLGRSVADIIGLNRRNRKEGKSRWLDEVRIVEKYKNDRRRTEEKKREGQCSD